ncbi:MAG: butyrate kinase [Bacteroidales bacterium]|nr:butyrate kinase [Bacteroidales bacterium]
MKTYHILTINPGSTSTKIGVFKNEDCLFEINVSHSPKQLEQFANIWDQYSFRKEEIIHALTKKAFDISILDAVVGRGGLIKPIPSGTYYIDQKMINDARVGYQGHHASNLGCVIAYSIGWEYSIPAFIVDPPAVDDFEPVARISGNKNFERSSLLHALNIFATARLHAKKINKNISDLNLIVAHLGGGITVAALKKGRAINVNHGLYEGPFSPERSGALPLFKFLDKATSGKYSKDEMKKMVVGKGGLVSYFNTNDARDVEKIVNAGSEKYSLVFQAMAYQIAEEIGKRATNLKGEIDGILLTGGLAHSKMLTSWILERVNFIGKTIIYPGESELEALAQGALRVLRGEERARQYSQDVKKIGAIYWDNIEVYVKSINIIEDKFRNAGYIFRKERDNNMQITYVNCKKDEEKLMRAIEKFKNNNTDLIISIGSPISMRIGQYLKKDNIPVIFSSIYSSAIIADFEKKHNNNYFATCYAPEIKEQFNNYVLKIKKDIKKLGVLYRRGELQAEIQYDEIREFAEKKGIKLFSFEIIEESDFIRAKEYFERNKIEWVYIGTSSVIAAAGYDSLKHITNYFPTVCSLEDTVIRGGLSGYVIPWTIVTETSAKMALDILDNNIIKSRVIKPAEVKLFVNKNTAEKLKMTNAFNAFDNKEFV